MTVLRSKVNKLSRSCQWLGPMIGTELFSNVQWQERPRGVHTFKMANARPNIDLDLGDTLAQSRLHAISEYG